MIKAHVNKPAKISGSVYFAKLEMDGLYFVPQNVSPLLLSELGHSTFKRDLPKNPDELGAINYTEGGISIPDDVANYAIFTAGALLVGSIVKDFLKKSRHCQ